MNLEDEIRASAHRQAHNYHQRPDLAARIGQRRHQLVARRIAVGGISAALAIGGTVIAFGGRLDDRNRIEPAAQPGSTALPTTLVTTTVTTTSAPPTTSVTGNTTTAPPSTTTAPAATTVPTSSAVTRTEPPTVPVTSHPDMAPAYAGAAAVWPYGPFWNVPQMGAEPVRGSGCGSADHTLGETIPDGLWAGFIVGHSDGPPAVVSIDVVCVFAGAAAQAVTSDPSANIVSSADDYVIVNNSARARAMPMDADIQLRLGVLDGGGTCVDGTPTTSWSAIGSTTQVWIRIHAGAVTWVLADCA